MKTEVYSWRLSGELKSQLEQEARLRKVPVSFILDTAVRDWLKQSDVDATEEEVQSKLHIMAARCFGILASGDSHRSETVRKTVRERLRRRHGR
jgi:hypothetical protein